MGIWGPGPRVGGLLESLLLFQLTMDYQLTSFRPYDTTQHQCTSSAVGVRVSWPRRQVAARPLPVTWTLTRHAGSDVMPRCVCIDRSYVSVDCSTCVTLFIDFYFILGYLT